MADTDNHTAGTAIIVPEMNTISLQQENADGLTDQTRMKHRSVLHSSFIRGLFNEDERAASILRRTGITMRLKLWEDAGWRRRLVHRLQPMLRERLD